MNGHLAAELEETSTSERFLTLYNLAYAKEQAGIERAVLSNVFTSGDFTTALFSHYIKLVTKQDTYIKSTYAVTSLEFRKTLDQFIQSKESREVNRYRDIAQNSNNGFNVAAVDWFRAATARIDKLKEAEQTLLDEVTIYAQEKLRATRFVIIFESTLLFLMIVIAYAVFTTIRLRSLQSY
jgi:hypothetical protein